MNNVSFGAALNVYHAKQAQRPVLEHLASLARAKTVNPHLDVKTSGRCVPRWMTIKLHDLKDLVTIIDETVELFSGIRDKSVKSLLSALRSAREVFANPGSNKKIRYGTTDMMGTRTLSRGHTQIAFNMSSIT